MEPRTTAICAAILALALAMVQADATWAAGRHAAGGVGVRVGGRHHGGGHHGHFHHGHGILIHDRIGSGFADARILSARVRHQEQLHQAYRRVGLLRDGHDFHGHHPYPGSVPYRAHSGHYGRYGDYGGPSITIVSPPPVIIANPYFCDVCAVGFEGDILFYSHLRRFHAIPENALDSVCIAVGDQLVFAGY